MHPFQYVGLARARQAELIREAADARRAADLRGLDPKVEGASNSRVRVLVLAAIIVGGLALLSGSVETQEVLAAIRMS
jgi:hypothetical protein